LYNALLVRISIYPLDIRAIILTNLDRVSRSERAWLLLPGSFYMSHHTRYPAKMSIRGNIFTFIPSIDNTEIHVYGSWQKWNKIIQKPFYIQSLAL
jgi:hypothetical protein